MGTFRVTLGPPTHNLTLGPFRLVDASDGGSGDLSRGPATENAPSAAAALGASVSPRSRASYRLTASMMAWAASILRHPAFACGGLGELRGAVVRAATYDEQMAGAAEGIGLRLYPV